MGTHSASRHADRAREGIMGTGVAHHASNNLASLNGSDRNEHMGQWKHIEQIPKQWQSVE